MAHMPEWQAYRDATYPTFFAAVSDLLAGIRSAGADPYPAAERWFARRREAWEANGPADRAAADERIDERGPRGEAGPAPWRQVLQLAE
jgi:hypothetical protein